MASCMALLAWHGVDGIVRGRGRHRDASASASRRCASSTVIAQWEQDLASLQSGHGRCRRSPATARRCASPAATEGGMQVVAWSLRPTAAAAMWQRWADRR